MKDVGFPDVKSERKATSEGTFTVLNESHSDEHTGQSRTTVMAHDTGNDGKNVNTLANAEGNFDGDLSPKTNIQESVNDLNEIVRNNAEEKGHETAEHREVVSGKNNIIETGKDVENERTSSGTDFEKLKNLLGEDVQSETSETETSQPGDSVGGQEPSAVPTVSESASLESYFQELEDDMFGWDSDEDDNNDNDIENVDGSNGSAMTDEKTLCEPKEEGDQNMEESITPFVAESPDTDNVARPGQKDSSEGGDTHSQLCSDSTNTDETYAVDELNPLSNESIGSQNIITDDRASLDQPSEDTNLLEANESISNQKEQVGEEQIASDNTNGDGETQQSMDSSNTYETPSELTFDQANSGDEGKTQIPKLPGFTSEESNDKNEQGGSIAPPALATDEVRKQLKDVLVDVRFFLGMYV